MEAEQVAKRYAQGLFEVTRGLRTSEKTDEDFQDIARFCRQDRSLIEFLAAPQILDQDKEKVVSEVFEGKVAKELFHLIRLLVHKRRTNFIVEIAEQFDDLVLESRGIVKTTLITAIELTEQEREKISSALASRTGKTIQLECKVEPAIIAGAIAIVGDKIIDRSVRHDLRELRERLLELKVH